MHVRISIKLNELYDETSKLRVLTTLLNYLFPDNYKIYTFKEKSKIMSDEGLLNKNQEDYIKKLLDEAIKGNAITEPLSDIAIGFIVPFIDDKGIQKLLDKWNVADDLIQEIRDLIDMVIEQRWTDAANQLTDIVVPRLNTPLGDAAEDMIIRGILLTLVGLIKQQIEKHS